MKNIASLTSSLCTLFEQVKNDAIDLKKAGEMNNTAGKILKAYQVQLAYHALRGESPDIEFLAAPVRQMIGSPMLKQSIGTPPKLTN